LFELRRDVDVMRYIDREKHQTVADTRSPHSENSGWCGAKRCHCMGYYHEGQPSWSARSAFIALKKSITAARSVTC
jgi:hypothetical protein